MPHGDMTLIISRMIITCAIWSMNEKYSQFKNKIKLYIYIYIYIYIYNLLFM